jgi:hypothetical protein
VANIGNILEFFIEWDECGPLTALVLPLFCSAVLIDGASD